MGALSKPRAMAVSSTPDAAIRRAVGFVALANLAYFGIEFAVARAIGSVALFADSIDFLEDASVNLLVLAALGWSAVARGRLGMGLAALLLVPSVASLWTAWSKLGAPAAPLTLPMIVAALGALIVNLTCAFVLALVRDDGGSMTRAAFLSARNDAAANVAIIVAGATTIFWVSPWPDVAVGLAIAALNLDAAREVFAAACHEVRATA